MQRNIVLKKENLKTKDGVHFYAGFGDDGHTYDLKVWIAKDLLQDDEIRFTGKDRKIIKTKKGSYILIPEKGFNVYHVGRQCGYRGGSRFVLKDEDKHFVIKYYDYKSPNGNLGISGLGFIVTKENEIEVTEIASGRLYGAPAEKRFKLSISDDKIEELELIPEDEELEKLI